MTNGLSTAELVIYVILIIPILYLLVKHGRNGLLGWLFLSFFCVLRIVGGGLAIKSSSPAATIISNVGLSPLLLATGGLLHEARSYRIHGLDAKIEQVLSLLFHMLVVAGVALTAAGSAKLEHHQQPIDKDESIVKAGIALLTVSWGVLAGWTAQSFTAPRATHNVARAGTLLLSSIGLALVFIGIRVFYSLVALSTERASLNPTTGSLAIRVVLGFLPELIATLIYIAAGFATQNAARQARGEADDTSRKPHQAPYV
ncbi:hypothetical protein Plec18167_002949 [Paecilomyces lecythidis]|uniref:DUF7702 domain-containing protein n=1 Tax=Paecilomyces lecythidis TaxID=3004212 RepID=A0ABR3Y2M6_9EURO